MTLLLMTMLSAVLLISGSDGQVSNPLGTVAKQLVNSAPLPSQLKEIANQVVNCATSSSWKDPYIGQPSEYQNYCNPKCERTPPGVLCCAPMSPKEINASFALYEKDGSNTNLTWDDVNDSKWIAKGSSYKKVVIVTHGYFETGYDWMPLIKDGYLKRGEYDAVILLYWNHGNGLDYFQAVGNVRTVGAMMGKLLTSWHIHERTRAVGFSLGAQIMGEAGKYVKQHAAGRKISECHGLDPAGPLYDGCPDNMILDKSDCTLVQVIHTSGAVLGPAGPLAGELGTRNKAGHCDYWINCGYGQDPCEASSFIGLVKALSQMNANRVKSEGQSVPMNIVCSHMRATQVYVQQVSGQCKFAAHECNDCGKGSPVCQKDGPAAGFDVIPDGKCDPSMDKNFYVSTKRIASGSNDKLC